jgi:hypothetical protein
MISTIIAGLSLLLLSGLANTYISYVLFGEVQESSQENDF